MNGNVEAIGPRRPYRPLTAMKYALATQLAAGVLLSSWLQPAALCSTLYCP